MSKYPNKAIGIKVANGFAALKVEETFDDEDEENQTKKQTKSQQLSGKSKSKAKAKNTKNNVVVQSAEAQNNIKQFTTTDWETWRKKDEEFTEQLYREHLKKALVDSKLEFETDKHGVKSTSESANAKTSGKPIKMTLDEFQKKFENPAYHGSQANNGHAKKELDVNIETEKFIDEVEKNVEKYVAKDKRTSVSEAQKNEVIDKYLNLQYKDQLEKKELELKSMTEALNTLKEEIVAVKKRNKQLLFMLSQGEMQEKSELLTQIEDLTSLKNDLTSQVTDLHKSLEQEKSKVHHLENELKKASTKSGKH